MLHFPMSVFYRDRLRVVVLKRSQINIVCTVNVDFVIFEYVLLIKYQSMSIWEFNMPIKQHSLIWLDWISVLGIFKRKNCLNDKWEGWGGMRGCCWTAS